MEASATVVSTRESLIRAVIEQVIQGRDFVKLTKPMIDRALRGNQKLQFAINREFCNNTNCIDASDVFKTNVFNYLRRNCRFRVGDGEYVVIGVGSNGEVDTYAFIARKDSPKFGHVCHNYKLARRASFLLDTSESFRQAVREFTKSLMGTIPMIAGLVHEPGEPGEDGVSEDVLFKTAKDRFGFEPELLYLGAVEQITRDLRRFNLDLRGLGGVGEVIGAVLSSLVGDVDVRRVARVLEVHEGFIVFTLIPWYIGLTPCFAEACLGGEA